MPDLDSENPNDLVVLKHVALGVELKSQTGNQSNKPLPLVLIVNNPKQPAINFKEQGRADKQGLKGMLSPYTAIDHNANKPQVLTTPLPGKINSDNITADERERNRNLGKLPAFTEVPKIDQTLVTPEQKPLTRLGMILTLDKGQIREIIGTRVDTGVINVGSRSREEYIEWVTNDLYKKIGPYQREGTLGGEWDNKIVGFGQKTGTAGHAEAAELLAVELAKQQNVKAVFLNQGINKIADLVGKSNFRPDVAYITKDGKIHVIEVESKSDTEDRLKIRTQDTLERLKKPFQGTWDVKEPGEIIKKNR